ncbi:hypothetical protein Lfu02_68370 [Longispora fulva]|uniref:ABC-type transport system involved in multi-copper enzyme maturation permease subunit n=1 Tax=Longispora fulva TaxID=619741 RepID=A0A8J7KIJ4_9ACTN|nr:ABC transporter permease subunit [Longispora fulva]MBG6134091.1 ABC-type transport system involved in multi-copper enzyme maturation permease subunit [Longispora fulva]GIG62465.1 hypothetical protein Lfu02_68370 [Longispora fulva]
MSTIAAHPASIDLSRTRPTPFSRLVRVELRKSYDTRSGFWLLAATGLITVAVYTVMLLVSATGNSDFSFQDYAVAGGAATSILLPIVGILLVTSEWSQRTTVTTFVLESNRSRVILAKLVTGLVLAVLVTGFVLATAAVAAAGSAVIGDASPWSVDAAAVVGLVLTQSLAMLGGFALATLLLNSPAAIVVFFLYKFLVPNVFSTVAANFPKSTDVLSWIDFQAAQRPLADLSMHGSDWAHLAVTATVWLALPLALGLRRVLRAEVK